MRRLYCIFDKVAATFIGTLVIDRADAPVIRMFHDVLADPKTGPGQHPNDYELRLCGVIADDGHITAESPVVIATGGAWLAANPPKVEA